MALVTRGLQRIPTLPALLPEWALQGGTDSSASTVLAWGHKPSARIAEQFAQRHGLPLLRAEDGFLRSTALGHLSPPLSIVLDDLGIYYDAAQPSRLESLITTPLGAAQLERGAHLRAAWVAARVSKYNHAHDGLPDALLRQAATDPPVLVIDQTAGDASITGAGASATHFRWMLQAALDEHPGAPIWLKVHPDVIAGRKQGHFADLTPGEAARVTLIAEAIHPPALFDVCRAVYVVSSQVGFEALLHGRSVRSFGLPFYAGWGLTTDHLGSPTRRRAASPSIAALAHAALIAYPRCLDPETGRLCEPERLLAHLALQRRQRATCPSPVQVLGFSRWKRPIARAFLQGSADIAFLRRERQLDPGTAVAVWGRRPAPPLATGPVLRIEDGFLRSVGLGADLTRPLSWVIDDLGIYFDATRPSRLEQLLRQHDFDDALRERARALRTAIVNAGLTKYNVGGGAWQRPPTALYVVLVPGQVESDASIQWGAADIRTNAELLRAVRAAEPDAWLVYKPHPDVVAGLRQTGTSWQSECERLRRYCDEIVTDVPMHALLASVDGVHTLTSLTGFEALLRDCPVTTWGMPFYAGWGLTEDRAPAEHPARQRRRRRLLLDELVAATLILYPTYLSRHSGAYTTPEQALVELREWQRLGAPPESVPGRAWRLLKRRVLHTLAQCRQR
ncbi:capsular polysaccharide biosynthesis protein [Sphaerotilus sp.]|uniref:capsular polysaccharide biosynthesis protein n=1 Tax=Sphaerotilus sp. TaxID=2093942 RepID=UPI00286D6A4D|nr:capsular polysaccharide biosynthesis protein [Sphaerotilus sp.]